MMSYEDSGGTCSPGGEQAVGRFRRTFRRTLWLAWSVRAVVVVMDIDHYAGALRALIVVGGVTAVQNLW